VANLVFYFDVYKVGSTSNIQIRNKDSFNRVQLDNLKVRNPDTVLRRQIKASSPYMKTKYYNLLLLIFVKDLY